MREREEREREEGEGEREGGEGEDEGEGSPAAINTLRPIQHGRHFEEDMWGGWGCEVSCGGHASGQEERPPPDHGVRSRHQCLTSLKYWPI